MHFPVMTGLLDRRMLVNYRVKPDMSLPPHCRCRFGLNNLMVGASPESA